MPPNTGDLDCSGLRQKRALATVMTSQRLVPVVEKRRTEDTSQIVPTQQRDASSHVACVYLNLACRAISQARIHIKNFRHHELSSTSRPQRSGRRHATSFYRGDGSFAWLHVCHGAWFVHVKQWKRTAMTAPRTHSTDDRKLTPSLLSNKKHLTDSPIKQRRTNAISCWQPWHPGRNQTAIAIGVTTDMCR